LRANPGQSLRIGRAISPPEVRNPVVLNTLAANVWARHTGPRPLKSVLFVSAERRFAASDVAWDFAALLAQEQRGCVLLIDDDPNIPDREFDLCGGSKEEPGFMLQPLLDDTVTLLPPVGGCKNLSVLRIGAPPLLSASVLQSAAFERFLGKTSDLFGAVVVNAPHPALQPEMLLLCRHVDGVVLVVESERTRRQRAMLTAQQIEESGGRLLGVVLSRRRYRIPEWVYKWI
jgi:Mrp family chromosome partitioning ATPase